MRKTFVLFFFLFVGATQAQQPKRYASGQIRQMLDKLNVLGTVLYVAAHPDDENTRLITYYANHAHLRTAYLSATRGDGGQNLIGPEIREGLGVIRTQELLAARRRDGGQQFFSRANDFGYSKHPDETFNIWDKQQVLEDFVWVFRKFRPDVVITRFSTQPGVTHGHHTASAMLAEEAFELSGDPGAFPEQLKYVETWKPKKLFWNTSWWFFRNSGQEMDTSKYRTVNVGGYNPLLGTSYTEIAAESRSMHKSQGFGSSGSRGDEIEYLELLKGPNSSTPFEDIDTSWGRVEGSTEVAYLIAKAIEAYDEKNPERIIPDLLQAREAIQKLDDAFWKEVKTKEIDELIWALSGLYIELSTNELSFVKGDAIQVNLEAINRSETAIKIESLKWSYELEGFSLSADLAFNKRFNSSLNLVVPSGIGYTSPYWLTEKSTLGMYVVEDQLLRGNPENDPALKATISVNVLGQTIDYMLPLVFKKTDPVKGEVYSPVSVKPPVMVNFDQPVVVFGSEEAKELEITLTSNKQDVSGTLSLDAPKGWEVSPRALDFKIQQKGEELKLKVGVVPPKGGSDVALKASVEVDGRTYNLSVVQIEYDHIPLQTVLTTSQTKLVKLDLARRGQLIGYIEGAGDAIPEALQNIGYQVDLLTKDDVTGANLIKYDAVILGIRAFNTVDWLSYKNKVLFEYVKEGGNLIVQYNTNRRMVTQEVAPYSLKVSRDRVTVEEAPVTILEPKHPVVNTPNKLTAKDFEGWVQERGLYFPDEWDEAFTPILSANDPGESPKKGGLLVARYGKGHYVYSGYSWFRELPAGVPGAYRLFVNMISLGNE